MPIGTSDGEHFDDHFDMIRHPYEPPGSVKKEEGTPVPNSENNASVSSVEPPRGIVDKLLGSTGERYQTWPEKMARSALSAMALPGEVSQGLVNPDSLEAVERAADLAGLAVMGPAPIAKKISDGTLGSFMGVRSKTLDKGALETAQAAEREGLSGNEIYDKTGMFRGTDKRWRQEIDDSRATHTPDTQGFERKLPKVLDHPELYEAYPHLKDVTVRVDQHMYKEAYWNGNDIVVGTQANKDKGILMHEIQHAIQDYEAFAKGGSPGKPPQYTLRYESEVNKLRPSYLELQRKENAGEFLTAPMQAELDRLKHVFKTYSQYSAAGIQQARENYMALAGEVEARNVQTRADLEPLDRAKINPKFTEDTPESKQILTDVPVNTSPYMKP